jgi:hypothetical protein
MSICFSTSGEVSEESELLFGGLETPDCLALSTSGGGDQAVHAQLGGHSRLQKREQAQLHAANQGRMGSSCATEARA